MCCYFWVINASSGEKSCLQFSIPTGSRVGGEGGVSHRLKPHSNLKFHILIFLIFNKISEISILFAKSWIFHRTIMRWRTSPRTSKVWMGYDNSARDWHMTDSITFNETNWWLRHALRLEDQTHRVIAILFRYSQSKIRPPIVLR